MTEQTHIDPFREMNRYDGRNDEYRSAAVYEEPRRTLGNYWKKFHAARDCGAGNVSYIEQTTHNSAGDKHEYDLRCWECGHRVPEEEVLFVGGDWYSEHGWLEYGSMIDDLYLSPERVLELGPNPDRDELVTALNLRRIERNATPFGGGPIRPDQWHECETCDHGVPLLFDDQCRMCYGGEWTDRMQEAVNAYERKVREWHNNSFVHRLEQKIDPFSIKGRAFEDKILWRRHDSEGVPKLVEVKQCLKDDSDGHWEYVLTDVTHTREWRYHEDDIPDCFWDTGLYNKEPKPIMDDRIREVWERVKD